MTPPVAATALSAAGRWLAARWSRVRAQLCAVRSRWIRQQLETMRQEMSTGMRPGNDRQAGGVSENVAVVFRSR